MRETPHTIEKSVKLMEYLMTFLMSCLLTFPVMELWALIFGAIVCGLFVYFTAGKPPGYMQETAYRLGVSLPGLLPRNIKVLDR